MIILLLCAGLQNLVEVFRELGYDPEDHVPFSILSQHPSVLSLMESCTHHQLVVSFYLLTYQY